MKEGKKKISSQVKKKSDDQNRVDLGACRGCSIILHVLRFAHTLKGKLRIPPCNL